MDLARYFALGSSSPQRNGIVITMRAERDRRHLLRWPTRVLLVLVAVLLAGAGAGALYEAVASTRDGERYPAPGTLLDVGGYQVHLVCMGEGSPTVLLDAWSGGWSTEWQPVQPTIAQSTRVCACDRAGSGWSDLSLHDHTPLAYATEMHAVLQTAAVPGPYVLVAASYAGRVARLYTSAHPEQVLGLVLVDAVHEDSFSAQDLANQQQQLRVASAGNRVLSQLGVARLLGPELVPLIDGDVGYVLPATTRDTIAVVSSRLKNQTGNARLAANHQANDAELRAAGTLGDRPLIVLSSTQQLANVQGWSRGQAALAALSVRSLHIVADGAHLVAWQHPDLVVRAIDCVSIAAERPSDDLSKCMQQRSPRPLDGT